MHHKWNGNSDSPTPQRPIDRQERNQPGRNAPAFARATAARRGDSLRTVCMLLALALLAALSGCGGGGGLSLTAGSVPLGGRVVTGLVLLPSGAPAAGTDVQLKTFPEGKVIGSSITDADGRFALVGVNVITDLNVVITGRSFLNIETLIARSEISDTGGLDFGSVDARSTLVAAALRLEHARAPEDAALVIASQKIALAQQAAARTLSELTLEQVITDQSSRNAEALTLITPTANDQLKQFAADPSRANAERALFAVLGYLRAVHARDVHLTAAARTALLDAQTAGVVYNGAAVASALQAAGVRSPTATQVEASSVRARFDLDGLGAYGPSITPLEALVIAADIKTSGGFELSRTSLPIFLAKLPSR